MTTRLLAATLVSVFGFIWLPTDRGHAQVAPWAAGEAIPLAAKAGPLGATRDYEVPPVGTADIFGNGPYDLLLRDNRLMPFRYFTDSGVPVYGQPLSYKSSNGSLAPFIKDSQLWAIESFRGKIRLAQFNRERREFDVVDGFSADLPSGAGTLAARMLAGEQLAILFTKGDGKSRGVSGAHPHSAEYRPFDGSGIWRGRLSYSVLGSIVFEPESSVPVTDYPVFDAQRDFLIKSTGLCFVAYPSARQHGVMGAASQGMFYYFRNASADGLDLMPSAFLCDSSGNGLRHPGIFPSPVAIPDPSTGDSDLLVGDTGSLWFYNFSERFGKHGGPIYDPPVQALVEDPVMSLGALPVLTSGDVDGDGLVDLVAGNDAGHFFFIRNIGTAEHAGYDAPIRIKAGGEVLKIDAGYTGIQGPPESRWGYTCPTLVDWSGDGSLDIVYNSIRGDISVLLQEPGSSPPEFRRPVILKSDTMELHLVWRTQPAVTNWGVDGGPNCIIVNDEQNQLRRYWQVDDYNVTPGEVLRLTTGEPIQAHGKRFAGQFGRTKLQAIDWDGDGMIDLLVGTGRAASIPGPGGIPDDTFEGDRRQASVLLLRNAGTNDEPVFDYPRVLHFDGGKLEMGVHSCTPLAINLGRGKLDLLLGEEDGTVIYYPSEKLSAVAIPGK